MTDGEITVPYRDGRRHGGEDLHGLPHAARPRRPRARTASGSASVLMQDPVKALTQSYPRTKAQRLRGVPRARWSCTPTRRTTPSSPTPTATSPTSTRNFIPQRDTPLRLAEAGGRQRPGDRLAGPALDRRDAARAQPAERLDPEHEQLALLGGGAEQPEARRTTPVRGDAGRTPRGHPRACACWRTRRTSRSTRCAPRRSTATSRRSSSCCRRWSRRTTRLPASNPLKAKLVGAGRALRGWDLPLGRGLGADLAGGVLGRGAGAARAAADARRGGAGGLRLHRHEGPAASSCSRRSQAASDRLAADFGSWKTPWGEINRFQRHRPATSCSRSTTRPRASRWASPRRGWGSLASFGARAYPDTKKWYGTSGNSFVAVVEFGDRVRAQGGHGRRRERPPGVAALQRPGGALRDGQPARGVLLPRAADGHTERTYHPGQ